MEVKTNTAVETPATEETTATEVVETTATEVTETETKAEATTAEVAEKPKSLVDEYFEAKEQSGGKLLLYQVNDFFEVMGDDAAKVAEKFHLTLTTIRKDDTNGESVPMVGFPKYLLKGYKMALSEEGFEVEVISDTTDDTKAKGNDAPKVEIKVEMPIKPEEIPEIDYNNFLPIFDFNNLSDDEICEAACNRLIQDSYMGVRFTNSNICLPIIPCWFYCHKKALHDTAFARKVCIRSKSFNKALDYLAKEVRSLAGNASGIGLPDWQVYHIVEEYFDLDDAAIAEKEAARKAKEKAEREAKAAETKAKSKAKRSKKATDAKTDEEKAKKAAEKAKKAEEAAKKKAEAEKAATAQGSLFDLLGGCA